MESKFIVFTEKEEKVIDEIIHYDLTLLEAIYKIRENFKYRYMLQKHINYFWHIKK